MSLGNSSLTASSWTKSRRAAMEGAHAIEEAARHRAEVDEEEGGSGERPGAWPDDARAHRDRDHDGLPHRVYAHGAGMFFGFLAFWSRPSTGTTTAFST